MATKKVNRKKESNYLTKKAKSLHTEVLTISDELVEETIATGERWQNLMRKALKNGVKVYGKQQDLAFDTLESLKDQYNTGTKRLKKLVGFDTEEAKKAFEETIKTTTAKAKNTIQNIIESDELEAIEKTAKKAIRKTTGRVKTAAKRATKSATKASASVAKSATTAKEAVKKAVENTDLENIETTAKKAVRKTTGRVKTAAKRATKSATKASASVAKSATTAKEAVKKAVKNTDLENIETTAKKSG